MPRPIKDLMTPSPHTINSEQTLKFAQGQMREYNVRHLPVLSGGNLVGIISDRDIQFIESFEKIDLDEITVEEACTDAPYTVSADTSTSRVCAEMADRKIGSAIILEDKKVVGIFTWIDALKFLAKS